MLILSSCFNCLEAEDGHECLNRAHSADDGADREDNPGREFATVRVGRIGCIIHFGTRTHVAADDFGEAKQVGATRLDNEWQAQLNSDEQSESSEVHKRIIVTKVIQDIPLNATRLLEREQVSHDPHQNVEQPRGEHSRRHDLFKTVTRGLVQLTIHRQHIKVAEERHRNDGERIRGICPAVGGQLDGDLRFLLDVVMAERSVHCSDRDGNCQYQHGHETEDGGEAQRVHGARQQRRDRPVVEETSTQRAHQVLGEDDVRDEGEEREQHKQHDAHDDVEAESGGGGGDDHEDKRDHEAALVEGERKRQDAAADDCAHEIENSRRRCGSARGGVRAGTKEFVATAVALVAVHARVDHAALRGRRRGLHLDLAKRRRNDE
ncbi:hypothetical protein GQ600_3843 [Phytophthora cactorum]|nr:hypothetical protein GQ600_3843 [Phytophthora cactorum]